MAQNARTCPLYTTSELRLSISRFLVKLLLRSTSQQSTSYSGILTKHVKSDLCPVLSFKRSRTWKFALVTNHDWVIHNENNARFQFKAESNWTRVGFSTRALCGPKIVLKELQAEHLCTGLPSVCLFFLAAIESYRNIFGEIFAVPFCAREGD